MEKVWAARKTTGRFENIRLLMLLQEISMFVLSGNYLITGSSTVYSIFLCRASCMHITEVTLAYLPRTYLKLK